MSNALTTAARPLVMDPSAKAVLMALCDMAREPDDRDRPCEAWPPMHGQDGAVGLCDWTCFKERTVQLAVQRLVEIGAIARKQRKHGVTYTVLLLTPAADTGVANTGVPDTGVADAARPAADAPKALGSTSKRKKTTSSPSTRTPAINAYPMPEGCDPQAWADFLAARKRKRLPNTASAHKTLIDDLTRHATAEWPWPRLIALAAGKGWASVRNPDREDMPNGRYGNGARANDMAGPRRGYATDMLEAAIARPDDGSEGDPHADGRAQDTIPAWLRR